MNTRAIFHILLSVSLVTAAIAQEMQELPKPPAMGGDPFEGAMEYPEGDSGAYSGSRRGRLPQASDLSSIQCSFKTIHEQDDGRVLSGVLSAIQALEGTDSCQPPQGQDRSSTLLAGAITNYQNSNGGNLPSGYVGNVTTTCWNYERLFNQEYDFFLATFAPNGNTGAENFRRCSNAANREEAVLCAAEQLASQKTRWEYECAQSTQAVQASQAVAVQVETMQLAMRTLEEMISNPGCVDATGAARASLIQNGFQLASRAAMIGMDPSSPFTVLASGAVGLISRLLGDLFTSEPQSQQLIARTQFNDLACMYEDLEERAFRCARNGIESQLNANLDVERMVCAEVASGSMQNYLGGLGGFIPQLNTIMRQLATAPADGQNPLTSDQVLALAEELKTPVPGSDGATVPLASLLTTAADRVLASISPTMNRPQLVEYIQAHNLGIGPEGHTALLNELRATRAAADGLKAFVEQAQQKGTVLETEFELSPEQLTEVRSTLPAGGLESIDNVLRMAQRHAPDESDEITLFNARLDQGRALGAVVTAQNDRRAIMAHIPQDNGIMEGHRRGLQVMMARRFEDELDRLVAQAKVDQRNYIHANTTENRQQEIVTQSLWPMVRMCNQLRTLAIDLESFPQPDRLPKACNKFICRDNSMIGTFQHEMRLAGNLQRTGLDNRGRCSTADCNGFYSQFICKERNKIDSIKANLYNEMDRSGTICGQPFGSVAFD